MLLERDGSYQNITCDFRTFLRDGFENRQARFSDWSLHLSGIFTDTRLKSILEFRSTDTQSPGLALSVPAFWKGLVYDPEALGKALDLVADWSAEEVDSLLDRSSRLGLDTEHRDRPLAEWALEFLELAERGLERQGRGEERYLAPLTLTASAGICPADEILRAWEERPEEIQEFVLEQCRY